MPESEAPRRGYRRPLYKLRFADPQFEGLEVVCRGASVGVVTDLVRLADMDVGKAVESGDLSVFAELNGAFAKVLVRWNYEDEEGVPVPPTVDGVGQMDMMMLQGVVMAYIESVVAVRGPLGPTLSDGAPSVEASLPMEPLPESLSS